MSDRQEGYTGLNRFDRVDSTGEADKYIEFLDRVEALPATVSRRLRSYDRLGVRPGMSLAKLDAVQVRRRAS